MDIVCNKPERSVWSVDHFIASKKPAAVFAVKSEANPDQPEQPFFGPTCKDCYRG